MTGMNEMPARKRLLIVDDEPDIVRMLDTYFTGEGYDTVCVGSAARVLAAVSALPAAPAATGAPAAADASAAPMVRAVTMRCSTR